MYKFKPILKSLIWGGEKIAPYKQIETDQHNIGESWELSGVKDNESVVAEGPEAGTSLPELIARHGSALLGRENFERFGTEFPLLIKFIDARQDLSIQVHPTTSWLGSATSRRVRPRCGMSWPPTRGPTSARDSPRR